MSDGWTPDPSCSEEGVDQVLEHLRGWLLHPVSREGVIPVLSANGTYFTLRVRIEGVRRWQDMQDEVTASNIRWLYQDRGGVAPDE